MLVYFCATSFERINVINGNSKGGLLRDIHCIDPIFAKNCTRMDVFLDQATGDYYMYKKDMQMWMPIGNVGLHYAKAAEEDGVEGGFITKKKIYKPKPSKYSTQEVIKSKITERKCTIMKEHLHHWVTIGMQREFVAINESMWDPHPIGMKTTSAYDINYTIIAESEKGPEVIEHLNTIAVQFHIEKKYSATVELLNNFVNKKFELIIELSRADMTLEEAEIHKRGMMYTKMSSNISPQNNGAKTRGKALFIKRNSIGIETNSVKKEGIRPLTARSGTSGFTVRNITSRGSSKLGQRRAFSRGGQRASSAMNFHRTTPKKRLFSAERNIANQSTAATDSRSTLRPPKAPTQFSPTQIIKPEDEEKLSNANKKLVKKFNEFLKHHTKRNGIHSQKLTKTVRTYIESEITNVNSLQQPKTKQKKMNQFDMNIFYQLNLLKDMYSTTNNSKKDIRKMLHPAIDEENMPKYNNNLVGTKAHIKNMFVKKKKIKFNPKYYSRFKEFAKMPPSNLDVPVIRNASPYINEEELYRKEYLASKNKWIGGKNSFKSYFGKASSSSSSNFIPNYVTITPSEPPLLHKFRDMDRERWLDLNFKF